MKAASWMAKQGRVRGQCLCLAVLVCLLLPTTPVRGALSTAEARELLREANAHFRGANEAAARDEGRAQDLYRKAIMRYQRIVRDGDVENGGLYYNIGNAYFRMKDVGRAILNYRRAEQLMPNDPNLHQNLSYARARRLDDIQEPQKKKVLHTLFFWHHDLSPPVRSALFAAAFVVAWAAAGLRLFVRRPFVTCTAAASAVLALAFLGSVVVESVQKQRREPGVVLSEQVVARKGDSRTYEPSFKEPLHAGTEFSLIEDRGEWYQIKLADGRRCWVPAADVGLVNRGRGDADLRVPGRG